VGNAWGGTSGRSGRSALSSANIISDIIYYLTWNYRQIWSNLRVDKSMLPVLAVNNMCKLSVKTIGVCFYFCVPQSTRSAHIFIHYSTTMNVLHNTPPPGIATLRKDRVSRQGQGSEG